jgi:hypothetical protein
MDLKLYDLKSFFSFINFKQVRKKCFTSIDLRAYLSLSISNVKKKMFYFDRS